MFRTALARTAPRVARRNYSVATAKSGNTGNTFVEARHAQKEHAAGSADLWRKISFYVAIPLVAVGYFNSAYVQLSLCRPVSCLLRRWLTSSCFHPSIHQQPDG